MVSVYKTCKYSCSSFPEDPRLAEIKKTFECERIIVAIMSLYSDSALVRLLGEGLNEIKCWIPVLDINWTFAFKGFWKKKKRLETG